MHDADDLVERLGVDRVARAPRLGDHVGGLGHRRVGLERGHFGARGHHLLGGLLGELEDSLQEARILTAERAALARLLDQHPDLLRGVEPVVLAGRLDAAEAEQPVRRAVEEGDRVVDDPGEADQRGRDPARDVLGIEERQRLGNQFAQDDV